MSFKEATDTCTWKFTCHRTQYAGVSTDKWTARVKFLRQLLWLCTY